MAKKILKCKYDKHWNHYPIKELPLKDLWQSVESIQTLGKTPFKKLLLEDIAQNGLHFPIMVVHTSHKQLLEAKEMFGKAMANLPFWHNDHNPQSKYQWSIWGGSQRYDIAKHLKFTHVDCAVLPSIKKAISHQKEMRKPYLDKYYEGKY